MADAGGFYHAGTSVARSGEVFAAGKETDRMQFNHYGVHSSLAGEEIKRMVTKRYLLMGCMLLGLGGASMAVADAEGPALSATIGSPGAVVADANGDVYFSSSPGAVFKLDGAGSLTRIAGGWTAGFVGDGGPAAQALLDFPLSYPELASDPVDFGELVGALAMDSLGNLYVADAYNNRIRKIDADGTISSVAGTGPPGWPHGSPSDSGSALTTPLAFPQGIAVDGAGDLYIADQGSSPLREIMADGATKTLTRDNCGQHPAPGLCAPEQIAISSASAIYVADGYCDIRRVDADGTVTEVAGDPSPSNATANWTCGYSGDGGPATTAALSYPYGVALDGAGNLYVADTYNNCIRKVDTSGVITAVVGVCGSAGYSGDGGPAVAAQLNGPHGVAVDVTGNLYIADTANNRLRKVSLDGTISTVAGNGTPAPTQQATSPPPSPPTPSSGTSVTPIAGSGSGGGGSVSLSEMWLLLLLALARCWPRPSAPYRGNPRNCHCTSAQS